MTGVSFWVSGRPAPQGSKRHIGNGRMIEMSKAVGPWREAVRGEAQRLGEETILGPVGLKVTFVLDRPKTSRRDHPCVRPDLDKLLRAVLDGLTMSGIIGDDGQVCEVAARKIYGERQGAQISLHRLPALMQTANARAKEI